MSHNIEEDDLAVESNTASNGTTGKLARKIDALIKLSDKIGNPSLTSEVSNISLRHMAWYNSDPARIPIDLNSKFEEINSDVLELGPEATCEKHKISAKCLKKYLMGSKLWNEVDSINSSIAEGKYQGGAPGFNIDALIDEEINRAVLGTGVTKIGAKVAATEPKIPGGGIATLFGKAIGSLIGGIDTAARVGLATYEDIAAKNKAEAEARKKMRG
jgi:hypothetical protein